MPDTKLDQQLIEISDRSVEKKIQDFSDMLKDIETLDDKKRQLWREIYENAVSDRQNSYVVFTELFKLSSQKSTEYAVHGRTMTACIERMQKANEQLVKLAELIAHAQQKDEEVDPESLFDQIRGKK